MLTTVRGVDATQSLGSERRRGPSGRKRSVLLATVAVPLDPQAIEFAFGCARESAHPLVIAGFIQVVLGPGASLPAPRLDEILQPAIEHAFARGVSALVLKVRTPRPLRAILEIIGDVDAGLLAFGPDRTQLRPRRYTRAVRFLTDRAPCLLWLAETRTANA